MRAREFLLEAHLSKRVFYVKSRLEDLINRLKNNLSFTDEKTKDTFSFGNPAGNKELEDLIKTLEKFLDYYQPNSNGVDEISPNTLNQLPDKLLTKKWSEIHKDEGFGRKVTVGSVVEALVAIAIYTKLTNREIENIDASNVLNTIEELKSASPTKVSGRKAIEVSISNPNVEEISRNPTEPVTDSFELTLELTHITLEKILNLNPNDRDTWGRLSSAINYVNKEPEIQKYNKIISNNRIRDPINIRVTGLKGEKTDVEVTRNGEDIEHLGMSIKSGNKRYDQASGSTAEGNIKFFEILGLGKEDAETAMAVSDYLSYIPDDYTEKEKASLKIRNFQSVQQMYSYAGGLLSTKLRGDTDTVEIMFMKTLFSKLMSSITGGKKIVYADFDARGTYNKLNPEMITHLSDYINLDVDKNTKGKISFFDRDSGRTLFHVRLAKQKSGRIIHVFELDNLLDILNEVKQKMQQPQPSQPKPQATPQPLTPGVQNQQVALNVSQQPMGLEPKQ